MNWKEKERIKNIEKQDDAYQDKHGVWRWKSNDRVPPTDILGCWNLDQEILFLCKQASDKDTDVFLNEYRERMKNHVPDAEELFEMRAAFGEGTKVVNVITGKTYQL